MGFYRNLQKNRPQANALAIATSSALLAGMHIGFGILNFFLELQQWAWEVSRTVIFSVIIAWYVGGILGLILGKFLLSRQEKVVIGFLSLVFYALSGIFAITSPTEALTIGFCRALAGMAHGCIYITAIVHAGEITVKEMRGYLLASLHVCSYIGMFIYSIITANTGQNTMDPNRLTGIITLVYVVAGGFGYFFTLESPVFLIQRNRDADAKQVMMRLRSETVETTTLNADFLDLKTMLAEDERLGSSIFSDRNWRPLLIMLTLRLLSVMTFNLPLNFVRVTFAVSQTGQHVSTLISGLRMVSGLVLLFGFDHLPRRKLFLPSAIPPCMSLLILTILYATGVFNSGDIGPLISVCVFDFFAGLSVGQLTGILSAEAFALPKKVNSLVVTISFEYALQIGLCLSLMKIEDFELWMFLIIQFTCLGIMVVCVGLLIRFMPETSGKSLRDARDLFRGYRMDNHDF